MFQAKKFCFVVKKILWNVFFKLFSGNIIYIFIYYFSLLLKILVISILKSLMVNSSVLMTCGTVSIPYYFSYGFCLFDNGTYFVMKIVFFKNHISKIIHSFSFWSASLGLITSIWSWISVTQGWVVIWQACFLAISHLF